MKETISTIISILFGSLLTFFYQYYFEIRKEKSLNKKHFINNMLFIQNSIFVIKKALNNMKHFLSLDISNISDDILNEEIYPSLRHFSKECSNVWSDFKNVLLEYFYRSINNTSFEILEKEIINIISIDYDTKYVDIEIYRDIHKNLQDNLINLEKAIVMIQVIEKKYYTLRNKCNKKKI